MDIYYSSWHVNNPDSHFDVWLLVCVGSSNYCPCYRLQLSVCDKMQIIKLTLERFWLWLKFYEFSQMLSNAVNVNVGIRFSKRRMCVWRNKQTKPPKWNNITHSVLPHFKENGLQLNFRLQDLLLFLVTVRVCPLLLLCQHSWNKRHFFSS